MDRAEKHAFVADMNAVFKQTAAVIVTHYSGLNVAQVTDLRRRMRDGGASFKVTKNRLTKLALADTPYAALAELLTGPTGIAYSDDPVAAAKVTVEFAKQHDKLVVLGGAMGATLLNADGVKALAELPSLDELRGKIVGLLQAPAGNIARVLQAPGGQVARVLAAYAEKAEAA